MNAYRRKERSCTGLTPSNVDKIVALAERHRIETLAVSLLFYFLNPRHEKMIARAAKEQGIDVSLSSTICPEFREYERSSTTVINAYITPVMRDYLRNLDVQIRRLKAKNIRIVQSNGGTLSARGAREQPVHTLLSGPAAGVLGALSMARQALAAREETRPIPMKFITFDMGGTSTNVALIDQEYQITTEAEVGGYPVKVPMIDIHTGRRRRAGRWLNLMPAAPCM